MSPDVPVTEIATGLAPAIEAPVAAVAAPAATEAVAQFTPDLAAADTLSKAVGGGAEGVYADDIMGDIQPEMVLSDIDTILSDVAAQDITPSATSTEDGLSDASESAAPDVPPVAGATPLGPDVVSPSGTDPGEKATGEPAADSQSTGEEPLAGEVNVQPNLGTNAEPESVRDQLTSRIDKLNAIENPTPEDKRGLTKAGLELAERDRRDTLNAAEPGSLSAEDTLELKQLNEKYGTKNANAAPEANSPATESTQILADPGEFNEQELRDQIENDLNRKNWTQDQKEAYINAQRNEHDKKKAEYDAAMKEKEDNQELTTAQQKQKLDQELQQVQQDLIDGKITAKEAGERLTANKRAREQITKSLVERFKKGEEMTPFEKEVAEKSIRMQQLMAEIQMAPKVMTAMEKTIKNLKSTYSEAARYQIDPQNADSPDTRKNIALRAQLSNQIAAQAAHMARYSNIVGINVNEFKSVNSDLMRLIGVRNGFVDLMVQIGTGIRRKANSYTVDVNARAIAKNA